MAETTFYACNHLRHKDLTKIAPLVINVYVWVAIVIRELKIELSLGEILQILSIVLFEKVPITRVLTKNLLQNNNVHFHNQLLLFDL